MKSLLLAALLALLAGCATHDRATIAAVRAAGVAPRTVAKLEHRGIMEPSDLIELRRRGIHDRVAVRQLDEVGVNYLVQRREFQALRQAEVRPAVRDALVDASDRFARDRNRRASYFFQVSAYDPYPYYDPWYWPLGGYVGYGWSGGHRHHHHHHHRHH